MRVRKLPATPEDIGAELSQLTAQRPYRNGVTVYKSSGWLGNGFGNTSTRVAVADGLVVGVYHSDAMRITARSADCASGQVNIVSEGYRDGRGERVVTKTAFNAWIESMKSLDVTSYAGRPVLTVHDAADVRELQELLGVGDDWSDAYSHGVTVFAHGDDLDNVIGPTTDSMKPTEVQLDVFKDRRRVAVVSVATLLALAGAQRTGDTHAARC